jgi:Domain of unknown function (DUF4382)
MSLRTISAGLLCLGLTMACGGSGMTSYGAVSTGNLTLRFGSDSFPGYDQAVVSLEKVEGSPDGTHWATLGNVQATYDLMALQNGNSAVILPATKVTPGTYTQFRITWATQTYPLTALSPGYVYPSGSSLSKPMALPTTTTVNGSITVPANGNVTAQIMLSGQQAVQARATTGGTSYTFQATGGVYDLGTSARITGHLESGTTPLAGAEVFAETLDGTLLASVQRRAFSDASGNYVLEGLPSGSGLTYFVASQPSGTITTYPAAAALPVTALTATTYTADLSFGPAQTPGSLTITITPPSSPSQGTWVELRQSLSTGGVGTANLIVRSQTVATGLTQDQAGFLGLAPVPGLYGVTAQRSSSGATPVMKTGTAVQVSAGGATTPAPLTYP